jgi:hypothetical protein
MQIVVEAEAEPTSEHVKNDIGHAVSRHDGEYGFSGRERFRAPSFQLP